MNVVQLIFIFILVLTIVKAVLTYNKNENSPIKSVMAELISKEKNLKNKKDIDGFMSTREILTLVFKLENGSELRFDVGGRVFRDVPENEWGNLTFQGKRFLKFQSSRGVIESSRKHGF